MAEINYHLNIFDGPLDLLLKLISKNKLNIWDIPISLIFDQYMEYINRMQSLDMDIAGEFIIMAADLMLIKSKMMLPRTNETEDEDDPRQALAQALSEYKKAKELASALELEYKIFGERMAKDSEIITSAFEKELTEQDPFILSAAMNTILNRMKTFQNTENQNRIISEKEIINVIPDTKQPVTNKIITVMKFLFKNGDVSFYKIFEKCDSRDALIATFIALLELIRSQRVILYKKNDDSSTGNETADELMFRLVLEHKNKRINI